MSVNGASATFARRSSMSGSEFIFGQPRAAGLLRRRTTPKRPYGGNDVPRRDWSFAQDNDELAHQVNPLSAWWPTGMGTHGLQQSFPLSQSLLLIPLTFEGHTGAGPQGYAKVAIAG